MLLINIQYSGEYIMKQFRTDRNKLCKDALFLSVVVTIIALLPPVIVNNIVTYVISILLLCTAFILFKALLKNNLYCLRITEHSLKIKRYSTKSIDVPFYSIVSIVYNPFSERLVLNLNDQSKRIINVIHIIDKEEFIDFLKSRLGKDFVERKENILLNIVHICFDFVESLS